MKTKTAIKFAKEKGPRPLRGCVWPSWLAILLLWLAWLPALDAATITTDESDYAPFTLVIITGTGFQPGETVDNHIVQVSGPAPGTVYAPWTAQADANAPIDASGGLPDGSQFADVDGLEAALLRRPELFVSTLAEKLLTYASGRGVEYYDMPVVRSIVRDAEKNNYRFSAIILGIVKSPPFQLRMKL